MYSGNKDSSSPEINVIHHSAQLETKSSVQELPQLENKWTRQYNPLPLLPLTNATIPKSYLWHSRGSSPASSLVLQVHCCLRCRGPLHPRLRHHQILEIEAAQLCLKFWIILVCNERLFVIWETSEPTFSSHVLGRKNVNFSAWSLNLLDHCYIPSSHGYIVVPVIKVVRESHNMLESKPTCRRNIPEQGVC